MWSLSRHKRALAAACAAVSLLALPSTSSAEPGPYPGLPYVDPVPDFPPSTDRNITAWLNAPYTGLAGSTRALQWSRVPIGTLASNIAIFVCSPPGGANPCPFPTPEGMTGFYTRYHIAGFLVSPDGSSDPYGDGQVMTIRTVAFGSIPVEVDVQISQTRDADGLPVPIILEAADYSTGAPGGPITDYVTVPATLKGKITVGIDRLRIDGVDVGLTGSCSTSPTDLQGTSEEARVPIGQEGGLDTKRFTVGTDGGGATGKIDIPAFGSCATTTGDDVGPILTSALSGPDNPVSVQYGGAYCFADYTPDGFPKPTPAGADTPTEAGCTQYQQYPDLNPDRWNIPLPWDIPDYAPGATAP